MSVAPQTEVRGRWVELFAAFVVVLTIVRLIGLHFSVVDLFFDESQYWAWAQAPDFGYFSKPPLLAWIIGASQTVCGASEACIRAPAPLLHGATAFLIYAIAQRLFSARAAFWSGLIYLLAPGIVFSTRIISTDVPLLFCWALALLAFVELRRAPRWGWAVVLGLAVGFGMLAKYAMIYFVACAVLAAMMDEDSRRLWRTPQLWAAPSAIAMTILATAVLVMEDRRRWLMASVVIGLVVQAVLLIGDHIADRVTIPGIRNGDVYARTMGWHRLGDDVAVTAKAHGAHGIAADTRDLVSSLIYYTRDSGLPVFAWPPSIVPSHEFDISRPLKATSPAPILFVTECPLPARLTAQFGSVTSLGPVTMVRGPTSRRSFSLFLLDQPKGALGPLAGCG